jgi:hypothetical protein
MPLSALRPAGALLQTGRPDPPRDGAGRLHMSLCHANPSGDAAVSLSVAEYG